MERGVATQHEFHRSQERLRVFDELAPLRMLASDKLTYGSIRPETWRQIQNEELTFLAEGLDAPLQSRFTLRLCDSELVDERGKPLAEVLEKGVRASEQAACADSRLWFMTQRAVHDYHEGQLIESLMEPDSQCNTIASWSPFPVEAFGQYGAALLESQGYQPKRALGFLRVYTKVSDTELVVTSLSVDNSDLTVFRTMAAQFGVSIPPDELSDNYQAYRYMGQLSEHDQRSLPSQLLGAYDAAMSSLYAGVYRAGRPYRFEQNAWEFVTAQTDLLHFYCTELEALSTMPYSSEMMRREKRRLTYGYWAAVKARFINKQNMPRAYESSIVMMQHLEQEVAGAFARAALRHEVLIGCGGGIGFSADILDVDPENALASIMGDKKEDWVWKDGKCRIDNCPTRPHTTKVGPCEVCHGCQEIYDKGKDPKIEYSRQAAAQYN